MNDFPDYVDFTAKADQSSFAKLAGVSRQAIGTHVKNGVLSDDGSLKCWQLEYMEHLRSVAAGRPENDGNIKAATFREKMASARLKEIQADQLDGVLVNVDEVYADLLPMFLHIKTQLEASSSRLSTLLSAKYGISVDKRDLDSEFRLALSEMTRYVESEKGE